VRSSTIEIASYTLRGSESANARNRRRVSSGLHRDLEITTIERLIRDRATFGTA